MYDADTWPAVPFGMDGDKTATWTPQRTVLVIVHHPASATRLAADIVPLIEADERVQTVYSLVPGSLQAASAREFLHGLGGLVLPWRQAGAHRFDLAVAANYGHLGGIHAPILALDHGAGPGPLLPRRDGHGPEAPRAVACILPNGLLDHGRVVPATIGVANERHRALLAEQLPPAAEAVRLVGDLCFDRMRASLHLRDAYRRALGVGPDQRLVVVASHWRTASLLGRHPDLPVRVHDALAPRGDRVVTVPHPNTWSHGRRSLYARLAAPRRAGLGLIPPEEGWRAALIAADLVIGDYGSTTYYAAAIGRPVLLGAYSAGDVHPGSHTDLLGRTAPHLRHDAPLAPQVDSAIADHSPDRAAWFRAALTSAPDRAARLLRREMYRLMRLAEPADDAVARPLPLPRLLAPLPGQEAA
jgi:hypothetical protein